MDVVTWYLNHPQFSFSCQNRAGGPGALYEIIHKYVELEQWENAMKLAFCRQGINSVYEERYGLWNDDVPEDNLVSKIFDSMTDFTYVDCNQTKIVDIIFQMYLEEIPRFKVAMGKKLLELGANKEALNKAFIEALSKEGYYGQIYNVDYFFSYRYTLTKPFSKVFDFKHDYDEQIYNVDFFMKKIFNRLIETGADVNCKNSKGQTALTVLTENDGTEEALSTLKLLLDKGVEVPDDALLVPLEDNRQAAFLLIQHDKEMKLKIPENYDYHMIFYDTTEENRMDVVTWYLNHPQFSFSCQNRAGGPGALYEIIHKYVELEQWENAMKLAFCRQGINSVYEERYGLWNDDVPEDNLVSKIFESMTDFTYVDCNQTTIVEIIFQMYLEEIHRFKVVMGKKLLELGASKEALTKAFSEALNKEGYYGQIYNVDYFMEKIIKRLTETGIDLESTITSQDEEILVKDRVYLAAAKYGIPDLLKHALEEGADLFINFDASSKKSSVDFCMKKPDTWRPEKADECLEIILKEISKRGKLEEQKIKDLVPEDSDEKFKTERRLVDYLKENGNLEVLSKIGFLPRAPVSLLVTSSGDTCHLEWECGKQGEYPVTGYVILAMKMGKGQEKVKRIKELLRSNPRMKMLMETMGGEFEEEFDKLTEAIFQESWETATTALYRGTELGEIFELMPEVDKKIRLILQENAETGVWKTMAKVMEANKTNWKVSPLQHGSMMKFRVLAVNENGVSTPAESDFHKITVKPNMPITQVSFSKKSITWTEPEDALKTGITMYRVEVRDKEDQWKVLGEVSAQCKKEVEFDDLSAFTSVRVIAVNDAEESEASEVLFPI